MDKQRYITNKKQLKDSFNEGYYNSINYNDYLNRQTKYNKLAKDLIEYLNITPQNSILDYGCAVGFLLNGFYVEGLPYNNLSGYDISLWATQNKVNKNLNITNHIEDILKASSYDYMFVLDVFEHMFDDNIHEVLTSISSKQLIVRIPVKLEGEDDFHLEVSRQDVTHVNCKTKEEWIVFIENYGYKFKSILNIPDSIYNSPGCFCGVFIKSESIPSITKKHK